MKKKQLYEGLAILAILAVGIGWAVTALYSTWADIENSKHINPELLKAFALIEIECSYTEDYGERQRCNEVRNAHDTMGGRPTRVNARQWHNFLTDQDYDLPTLYEPGYTPW